MAGIVDDGASDSAAETCLDAVHRGFLCLGKISLRIGQQNFKI